jgi:hypothetical protein
MLGAGREAVVVSIVHACPYVVSLIAPFSTNRLRSGPGPGEVHEPCALPLHALLLETTVAASQVAVFLGYIPPPPCSSSISYNLAPQSNICDHPGLAFFSSLVLCHSSVRVLDAASRAIYASVSLRLFIFHRASLQGKAPSS